MPASPTAPDLWQEALFGPGQALRRQARRPAAAPRSWRRAASARRSAVRRSSASGFNRDDRPRAWWRRKAPLHAARRSRRCPSGARFSDRKFGDRKPYAPREGGGEKRPYTPRGEGFRKDGDRPQGDRPFGARPSRDGDRPRGDRPERKFGGDKKFSRGAPDRGPRKDFGSRDPGIATAPRDRVRSRRVKTVAEARCFVA